MADTKPGKRLADPSGYREHELAKTQRIVIAGPYVAPKLAVGDKVHCLYRGEVVTVAGHRGPKKWPYCQGPGSSQPLIVTPELARAIALESVCALVWYWGANRSTVHRWRRALGAPRFNLGTVALWRRQWSLRLGEEGARRGGLATRGIQKRRKAPAVAEQ